MWCFEWCLLTRAENVSDILSNTQEDMKQKRRIETIRCGAPCSLRWSGVVHLAALTIQQEGAGGRSPSYLEFKWRKWQRMSPWNFSHQECYTLLLNWHSLRDSGHDLDIWWPQLSWCYVTASLKCTDGMWPHSSYRIRGHQGAQGLAIMADG